MREIMNIPEREETVICLQWLVESMNEAIDWREW